MVVRAIYRDGNLHLLDNVNLQEGEEVNLQILPKMKSIQDLVSDLLVSAKSNAALADEDELFEQLDDALKGKQPLSEIVIKDRDEGR